ncbi:MAG: hypothetical protein IT371_18085 [Deltaproteobacteria bacterium]|nr:hypothetical protein [Deltaproteobacteria bacterium]
MRLRCAFACLLACGFLLPAPVRGEPGGRGAKAPRKGSAKGDGGQDLARLVAERLRERLGVPVRIGEVAYQLFESTFVARRIALGAPGLVSLSVAEVRLRTSLLQGGGRGVERVQVRELAASLPAAQLGRGLRVAQAAKVRVEHGQVEGGTIRVVCEGGARVELAGLRATLRGLAIQVDKPGAAPRLEGQVTLTAERLTVGALRFTELSLEARFSEHELVIERLAGKGLDGAFALKGGLVWSKSAVGPLSLAGRAEVGPLGQGAPALVGQISVVAHSRRGLSVTGQLEPKGAGTLPSAGGLPGLPTVKMQLAIGKRTLRGTGTRWRLR